MKKKKKEKNPLTYADMCSCERSCCVFTWEKKLKKWLQIFSVEVKKKNNILKEWRCEWSAVSAVGQCSSGGQEVCVCACVCVCVCSGLHTNFLQCAA